MRTNEAKLECVRKAITLIDNTIKLTDKQRRAGSLNKEKVYIYVYKDNECIDKLPSVAKASEKYGVSKVRVNRNCNGETIRSEYTFVRDI